MGFFVTRESLTVLHTSALAVRSVRTGRTWRLLASCLAAISEEGPLVRSYRTDVTRRGVSVDGPVELPWDRVRAFTARGASSTLPARDRTAAAADSSARTLVVVVQLDFRRRTLPRVFPLLALWIKTQKDCFFWSVYCYFNLFTSARSVSVIYRELLF